ncbi:MAG TPA: zinc-binding dehydrogenase [Streptosporangiaceae bacterium]
MSPVPTGCSTAPVPWSRTASRASSTTPARCCPASCDCWPNSRSGTTCPRASTRASTTSGPARESRTQPSGKPSGPRIRADLTHLFGLLSDGTLTAKIAARYPLTEVAAAIELAESSGRTALGKIILVP